MRYTENFGLPQFDYSDKYNLADYNEAYKKIEDEILNNTARVTDVSARVNALEDAEQVNISFLDQLKLKLVYGAKGDGVTDDTVAIQSYLDEAKTEGSLFAYIPAGTYIVDGLSVYENTYLKLHHNALLRRKDRGNMIINGDNGKCNPQSNITIDGGAFDMDNNHTSYRGATHFTIGKSKNMTFKNIRFLNNHGNHSLDLAGVENLLIENCTFEGFIVNPAGDRDYVEAIQISEFTQLGQPSFGNGTPEVDALFDGSPCKNVTIRGCKFDKNHDDARYGYWACGIGHHSSVPGVRNKNILIEDCKFMNCTMYGVRPIIYENTTIDNCYFEGCAEAIHLTHGGVGEGQLEKHQPSINTRITNCTFVDSVGYTIWSKGKVNPNNVNDIGYGKGILIDGCVFEYNGTPNGTDIYINICEDVIITNNVFTNTYRGVHLRGCRKVTADNNIINKALYEGIYCSINNDNTQTIQNYNITISNNKITEAKRSGILTNETTVFNISNNTLIDCTGEELNARSSINISTNSNEGIVSGNYVRSPYNKAGITVTTTCYNVKTFGNDAIGNSADKELRQINDNSVLFLGDSITYGVGATSITKYSYPYQIANMYEVPIANHGVSSMMYVGTSASLDINEKVKTITNLEEFNTVSIALGTNDWSRNVPLGSPSDSTSAKTVCGAMNKLIAYLQSVNPMVNITIFTPTYRENVTGTNANGITLRQMCDGIIACAEANNVRAVDLHKTFCLNKNNIVELTTDRHHPNDKGYNLLAKAIYKGLSI